MDEQIEQIALPCPFCAKAVEPEFYDRGERSSYWYVSCNAEEGEHQVRAIGDTEAEAIAAWNTRAAHSVMAGTIAELTEALTDAREAIASLDTEALGMVVVAFGDPERDVYPVRDELLAKADAALAPPRHD